jgi:protein Mpv17
VPPWQIPFLSLSSCGRPTGLAISNVSSSSLNMAMSRFWNRYIFNVFPLPHIVILTILLFAIVRIALNFNFHYEGRPLLTICVVASLLGGISDVLAQMIELIRTRQKSVASKPKAAGEFELEEKPSTGRESPRSSTVTNWTNAERSVCFDFPRTIRFMGFGFFFSPVSVGGSVFRLI